MTPAIDRSGTPKLLVSVRDAEEAEAAIGGGADWIDLKEPARGPLGAVDASVARKVVACVAGRVPISAAAGELIDWRHSESRGLLDIGGVAVLKLGLAGCRGTPWEVDWMVARREIVAAGKELAAVIYADDQAAAAPEPLDVVRVARESGCRWVLVDTFDKRSGTLASCLNKLELQTVFAAARGEQRMAVAAGRLELAALAMLPLSSLDMVAVRGAACDGGRSGRVSRQRVAELRAALTALCAP